jgi:hypothetical protein
MQTIQSGAALLPDGVLVKRPALKLKRNESLSPSLGFSSPTARAIVTLLLATPAGDNAYQPRPSRRQ